MPACVVGSLGRVVGEMEQLERFAFQVRAELPAVVGDEGGALLALDVVELLTGPAVGVRPPPVAPRGRPFPIGMSHRVDRYAIVSTCVLLFFVGWAVPLVAARLIEGRDLIEVLSPP